MDLQERECLHRLFEAQVARVPDNTALVDRDISLTYHELNCRANRLARFLGEVGVGRETLVGVYLERSVETVVAVLAVLKAGGAYVPLDPVNPPERIAFMLQDARVPVLLTGESLVGQLLPHEAVVVRLDAEAGAVALHSPENPDCAVSPPDLAYVIYTSGSTGRPKGVMVQHDNVSGLLHATQPWFGFTDADVWTFFHSHAFDFSVWEMWGALAFGGRLVIVPYLTSRSPEEFYELLDRQGVTILNQTPSAFRQLMHVDASMGPRRLERLRKIIFGGEALDFRSLKPWFARYNQDGPELINMYGITETTVHVTYRPLRAVDCLDGTRSMIGVAIPDMEVHVLDATMQPLPEGTIGELYVGGRGVARGYLNRPDLTEERFLQNPFAKDPGARLYRSGDLARRLPGGDLEYLGRADNQVQLRGFRVELGEIESILDRHPAVRQSCVVLRQDAPEDKRLVAYLVSEQGARPSVNDLRAMLQVHLADYMVPAAFVWMKAFPLTVNGKLDVHALPSPSRLRPDLECAYAAPRTELETILTHIWEAVLGIEPVGVHDDYFLLGGDSLQAVQVAVRTHEELGNQVSVRSLFEHPTVAGLAREITARPHSGEEIVLKPTPHVPVMSAAQQRLYFLFQLTPDNAAYNISQAYRIHGELDVRVLQESVCRLVQRHEALRTVFQTRGGGAVPVVLERVDTLLEVCDCQTGEVPGGGVSLDERMAAAAGRPFDLAVGPLVRFFLFCTAAQEFVLLVTMHHIVSDGWSFGVLAQDLGKIYTALARGVDPHLAELEMRYTDFAHWQQQRLQGALLAEQTGYWRKKLENVPPVLALPFDHVRPAMQSFAGRMHIFRIPESLTARLAALARRTGVTPFMLLLAGFQLLLSRYSGQRDIVVGVPVANRGQACLERLIGFFVNTLVLRTDLSGNPAFSELLQRVRTVVLEAFAHPDMPFEKLVQILRPERDPSHSPVFQVMFAYHNIPHVDLELPGMEMELLPVENRTSKFDMMINLWERDGGIAGAVEYCSDLFEPETIKRMVCNYQRLLEGVAEDPSVAIEQAPILNEAERHLVLTGFNATAAPRENLPGFFRLIERQMEKTPDAAAVTFNGHTRTYREINERANRLAHHLIAAGVTPGTCVGVSLERSIDMLVALLGILKAGGAYVPLDPRYPRDRLAFIMQDSSVPLLVTRADLLDRLPRVADVRLLCLDIEREAIARCAPSNPEAFFTAEHLAYVIYTSGSTGQPKGVRVPHGAVTNFLLSMAARPGITARDTLLAVTTLSFDIHVLELFLPLTVGARVVIAGQEQTVDGAQLVALMAAEGVTVMQATPVTWRLLIEAGWQGTPGLMVLCGGEAFPGDLVRELSVRAASVWNMYGPTETTVWSSCGRVTGPQQPVPIGRPLDNTCLYVLDAHLQPVPIGVPGELYIGGAGLARGYVNRPDLTARQFVPDPFSRQPGARLYRTGDIARYRFDGALECLHRIDSQVKVRGHRIELGEIETILKTNPGVAQTAVVVRDDTSGDARIVAYYVSRDGGVLEADALKRHLRTNLPDYMLPQHFVHLPALPLTPAGKIDRTHLPAPTQADGAAERNCIKPRTEQEQRIAAIWQEVLGVDPVGLHDSFFDLGGHSLLAAKLITEMSERLNCRFSLQKFFEDPTVAGMAERADAAGNAAARGGDGNSAILFPIQSSGSRPPIYFCAGAHDNDDDFLRYLSNLLPSLGADQPVYGFRPERLMQRYGDMTVERLAAMYIQEMRRFQPTGPYYIGAECVGGIVAYEMARQLSQYHQAPHLLIMLDTECPDPDTLSAYRRAWRLERLRCMANRLRRCLTTNPVAALGTVSELVLRRAGRAGNGRGSARRNNLGYDYRCMLFQYRPGPYDGRVTMVINTEDYPGETALGWDGVGIAELAIHRVPGNHVTRMTTYRNEIGRCIRDCLDEAVSHGGLA